MRRHDDDWIAEFVRLGHAEAEPLAVGMEGAVYRLGDGLVAKVWANRNREELLRLRDFYAALADQGLTFRTPRILRVHSAQHGHCTIEDELHGRPLGDAMTVLDGTVPGSDTLGPMLDVLAELAAVAAPERLARLPVLDESLPFRRETDGWTASLVALIDRRLHRFGRQLATFVPDFDKRTNRVRELLRACGTGREGLVHGDLVRANILIDDESRTSAVLDFGFLSVAGDPAFDAAVAASILDMYGPKARETEAAFDDLVMERFGYPRELLLLYRAAYALVTSNAYDPQGADGHFRWCVDMLLREDITALLEESGTA